MCGCFFIIMVRRHCVVLSDSEPDDDTPPPAPAAPLPLPTLLPPPGPPHTESDDDSMNDFIEADDDESEGESSESTSDSESASSGSAEDDDDDSTDSDSESGDDEYVPWWQLRDEYAAGTRTTEPRGVADHPEVHAPGWVKGKPWTQAQKDAYWAAIKVRVMQPSHFRKWGLVCAEREVDGLTMRVIHRCGYGKNFKAALENHLAGSYMKALIPSMVEVFGFQPWQPFFERGEPQVYPMFEDFNAVYFCDESVPESVREADGASDGPLWCLCCQCSKKGLGNVTVMRHTLSDIHVIVGGECATNFLGELELKSITSETLRGQIDGDVVGKLLGAW